MKNLIWILPVFTFLISVKFVCAQTDTIPQDSGKVFTIVDELPSYPGGEEALFEYLAENVRYPQYAKNKGIQGTVFAGFVIEKDGSITNIKILKSIGGGCDEEVIRVIENMPKWTPGKQRGKTVRVQFNLPIKFVLQNGGGKKKKNRKKRNK
ncbi:MAG: energy transducer TonB [Marinilabiliales bacterium]|nr:MAG: energy transducer TonB [Marinilabiliales bacterium]